MSVAAGLPRSATPAMIAVGDSIYHARACARCHGAKGAGGQNGPALNDTVWLQIPGDYDSILRLVTSGVPQDRIKDPSHKFNMQPRGGTANPLSDDQIAAVAAYVYTISHASTR
jgi:mono/diheme cytochrome c family protein